MDAFTTVVRSGAEAERFNDAFYRFLELNSSALHEFEERGSMMQTVPTGTHEEKFVTLWSEEALGQFVRFWRRREGDRPAFATKESVVTAADVVGPDGRS